MMTSPGWASPGTPNRCASRSARGLTRPPSTGSGSAACSTPAPAPAATSPRRPPRRKGTRPQGAALRLDIARAAPATLTFYEDGAGPLGDHGRITAYHRDLARQIGDVVLSRRDFPGSYHLAVVVDDAAQGVTHVIRGQDLFDATVIHVLLQTLLDLPTPTYHHHRLIRDDTGTRLAKRDDARAIAALRADGATAADIRRRVGL